MVQDTRTILMKFLEAVASIETQQELQRVLIAFSMEGNRLEGIDDVILTYAKVATASERRRRAKAK